MKEKKCWVSGPVTPIVLIIMDYRLVTEPDLLFHDPVITGVIPEGHKEVRLNQLFPEGRAASFHPLVLVALRMIDVDYLWLQGQPETGWNGRWPSRW